MAEPQTVTPPSLLDVARGTSQRAFPDYTPAWYWCWSCDREVLTVAWLAEAASMWPVGHEHATCRNCKDRAFHERERGRAYKWRRPFWEGC